MKWQDGIKPSYLFSYLLLTFTQSLATSPSFTIAPGLQDARYQTFPTLSTIWCGLYRFECIEGVEYHFPLISILGEYSDYGQVSPSLQLTTYVKSWQEAM